MTTYNYTFHNLSRIGDDNCGISARDAQNNSMGSYNTTNYFLSECGMKKPISFATQQPFMFVGGGPGNSLCGAGGCNVDSDSKLKIGQIQTNPKCRISLQQRPFATVPYLGEVPRPKMGLFFNGAMIQELKVATSYRKLCHVRDVPLIPSVAATI